MKYLIKITSIFLITVFSCSKKKNTDYTFKNLTSKNIKLNSIELDTLNYPELESSLSGYLEVKNDSLHFIDNQYGWVFSFNSKGQLKSRRMGQGKGPKEINTSSIDGFVSLNTGERLFLGSSFDVHIHKPNLERKASFIMDWKGNQDAEKVRKQPVPDASEFALYTLDYEHLKLRNDSNDNIYIPIYGENERFNGFINSRYYDEGRILAKLSLKSGKVEKIFGRRSKEYLKYKYVGQHAYFSYDIDKNDKFYISHEIDSLIYVYDKDFKPLFSFGNNGLKMDTDYYKVPNFDLNEVRKALFESKPNKGWFSYLEYIDEYDLLFRSYKKSGSEKFEGLQIYKGVELIADIEVPKGFKVIGNIGNTFYSDIIIEDDIKMKSYSFKLNL